MKKINPLIEVLPFGYRDEKPRKKAINYIRAPRVLGSCLKDLLDDYSSYIDILKLSGHQASLASETSIVSAIQMCRKAGVKTSVGNPVIDAALVGGVDAFKKVLEILAKWGVNFIEISGIARAIDDDDLKFAIDLSNAANIEVIFEIGVDFAHTKSSDGELFIQRRNEMARQSLESGAAFVLIESEGLTENISQENYRWQALEGIIAGLDISKTIFEGDDQDVLSKLIEIYGPKSNIMTDFSKIETIEAARLGFGPSQFLWGKVITLENT